MLEHFRKVVTHLLRDYPCLCPSVIGPIPWCRLLLSIEERLGGSHRYIVEQDVYLMRSVMMRSALKDEAGINSTRKSENTFSIKGVGVRTLGPIRGISQELGAKPIARLGQALANLRMSS